MGCAETNLNQCHPIDADVVNKLKKKIIKEFNLLVCLTEKGHKPNYEFILEEISLIGLNSDYNIDLEKLVFYFQFYLNNKWQIQTY